MLTDPTTTLARRREGVETLWNSCWALAAAFGTYFCMYAYRKPFTAAAYSSVEPWGMSEKTVLVVAQVTGYLLAKIAGIRVVSAMPRERRVTATIGMIGGSEMALLLFAVAPAIAAPALLFANGLALGMVFGMVLGQLEGRRQTEALAAGLCASFILADGVTKSLGTWLIDTGVSERWMPAVAGLVFAPALLVFCAMLARIPPPDKRDVGHRSERKVMTRADRRTFLRRYGAGLVGVVGVYLLVTVLRSIRADFAPEIRRGLGQEVDPTLFTRSETLVALGVLGVNGLSVLIRDNHRAFYTAIAVAAGGVGLVAVSFGLLGAGHLGGFWFMVLVGLGLYLPYVAVHTTLFERLLAMTPEPGNVGFLMYVADAVGYLGFVVVMLGRGAFVTGGSYLRFFSTLGWGAAGLSIILLAHSAWWFMSRTEARA